MAGRTKATIRGFDLRADINLAIRQIMPTIGQMLQDKMRSKIGIHQEGWPPLSPNTIARKRTHVGSKRWGAKRRRKFLKTQCSAIGGNTPLLDWGGMRRSVSHREQGNSTHVTVDFPAVIHEQDNEIGSVRASIHTPPRRAFMIPSLEESWEPIIHEIEDKIGGMF